MAVHLKTKKERASQKVYFALLLSLLYNLVSIWLQFSKHLVSEMHFVQTHHFKLDEIISLPQEVRISQTNEKHHATVTLQTAPTNTTPAARPLLLEEEPRAVAYTIPRRLMFTYSYNILETKQPEYLYRNIMRTIQIYAESWNVSPSNMDIMFLDDSQCMDLINQTEPRLVKPFAMESEGSYKADMCRIAALYIHGGYYFDVDIEVLKALKPDPTVDFITAAQNNNQFFQAVLAVSPSHPIMIANLQSMLDDWYMLKSSSITPDEFDVTIYRSDAYMRDLNRARKLIYPGRPQSVLMGTATLKLAFDRMGEQEVKPWLLHETQVTTRYFPELMRQETAWGCNFAVVDRTSATAYFYSRCRGTNGCPNT